MAGWTEGLVRWQAGWLIGWLDGLVGLLTG